MTGLPWADSEGDEPGAWDAASGREYADAWPENLAGPEYWSNMGDGDLSERFPPKEGDDGPSGEKQ